MWAVIRRFVALMLVVAAACSHAPKNEANDAGQRVTFPVYLTGSTNQPIQLEGIVRGRGSVGVLLAHMLGSDQSAWAPLIPALLEQGFRVMTFNFRGHGLSGGARDPSYADADVRAALLKFRELGVTRVLVVGASIGGMGAIIAARYEHFACIVSLSAPDQVDRDEDALAAMPQVHVPILFIVGAGDDKFYVDSAHQLYEADHRTGKLDVVTGTSAHGTDLLIDPAVGGKVRKTIVQFLLDNRG